jgi:hypothetical protein
MEHWLFYYLRRVFKVKNKTLFLDASGSGRTKKAEKWPCSGGTFVQKRGV